MASNLALYESVQSSNLPYHEKTALRKLFDTAISLPPQLRPSGKQVHGMLSAFRVGSESLLTGIGLGLLKASRRDGLDIAGFPIDGLGGFAMLLGSSLWASSELSPDARTIGGNGVCVWATRMTEDFLKAKRALTAPATHAGDPIVAASEAL